MKKLLYLTILVSMTSYAAATKPNGKRVEYVLKEKLVSERLEKTVDKVAITTNEKQIEKGDADVVDNLPKRKVNLTPSYPNYPYNKTKKDKLNNILDKLTNASYGFLNVPYLWGGTTHKGIDCSAFVMNSYEKIGVTLPRVSKDQAKVGKTVASISQARKGDLIFFYTDPKRPNTVSHVGMYLGSNKMIHASSSSGKVVVVDLNKDYFQVKMAGIKRIIDIYA